MAKTSTTVIGFDLGGTKMLAGVVKSGNSIVGRDKRRSGGDQAPDEIYKRICKTIDTALESAKTDRSEIAGIGIGCPGPIDAKEGRLSDTPNMNLGNFPLRKELEKEYKVPVTLENDVNTGTYGEYCFGAGKGARHVVGIFPGTGIGGGLVLDGRLYRGATGGAGELGHMIINPLGPLCGCGQRGCLEAHASRLALAKDLVALAYRGQATASDLKGITDLAKVRSKTIQKALADGDKRVEAIVMHAADNLGIGMANMVNILNPEVIILGGGLVEALPASYVKRAESAMRSHAMPSLEKAVKVVTAKLGDDAVLLGAAQLIRDQLGVPT